MKKWVACLFGATLFGDFDPEKPIGIVNQIETRYYTEAQLGYIPGVVVGANWRNGDSAYELGLGVYHGVMGRDKHSGFMVLPEFYRLYYSDTNAYFGWGTRLCAGKEFSIGEQEFSFRVSAAPHWVAIGALADVLFKGRSSLAGEALLKTTHASFRWSF